jgi:hypothetical protein
MIAESLMKKSNIKGPTSADQIRFVKAIQKCFDENSKMFINLFRVAFAEETLLMASNEVSRGKLVLMYEKNLSQNLNKAFVRKIKGISACLINSYYKFGVFKKV